MKLVEKYPVLGSSSDPEQVALTIKGILLTLIPVVVMVAGGLNVTLNPDDLVAFVNTLFGIFTLGLTAWGLIRKIYYKAKV